MPHHIKMQLVYIVVSLIPLVALKLSGGLRDTSQFPAMRRYAWTAFVVTTVLAAVDLVPFWLSGYELPLLFWRAKNIVLLVVWMWLLLSYSRMRSVES